MQNDILPPSNWRNTKKDERKILRGLSFDKTQRLFTRPESYVPELKSAKAHADQPTKKRFGHWSRRRKILVSLLILVLLGGGGFGGYMTFFNGKPAVIVKSAPVKAEPPAPKTVASPLTGLQVDPARATRPVTAIMLENSPDARPQSGLQEAGVVFEAIAEGGITRFMALFQEAAPPYNGPVRSLRPYYIDFAAPFQASIAHVGGSPDALAQIRSGAFRDIDQFFNAGSYWRVSSRYAPHNVYTSFEKLDALNKSKGYNTSQFTPWKRKADKPTVPPSINKIDISISSALYNVHYDYDARTNNYLRSMGGRPHIATASESDSAGIQLSSKVVIVLVMPYTTSGKYSVYGVTGSGEAYIFQDGSLIPGSWTKNDRNSQFVFKHQSGEEVALNAGQTWLTAVAAGRLTYSP
jgi:hypothetical protein